MFKRVVLKNFKGIAEGDIQLWPFTLLIGKNNSGKTTILEALYLAPNPFRPIFGEPVPVRGGRDTALHCLAYLHESLDAGGFGFLIRDYVAEESLIKYYLEEDRSCELRFERDENLRSRVSVSYKSMKDRKYLGYLDLNSNNMEVEISSSLLVSQDLSLSREYKNFQTP